MGPYLLLLACLFGIVQSKQQKCYLENNPDFAKFNPIDSSKTPVKIGYFADWDYSLVVTQFAKQLIEELLSVPVELVATPYNGESYVIDVNEGTIDAHITTYSGEVDIQLSNIRNLGSCGFQELIGWHIPSYMVEVSPELVYYKGWARVFEKETLFCENTNVLEYERYDLEALLQSSANCNDDLLSLECIKELREGIIDNDCKLVFISDPDLFDYGMDSSILKNLNLTDSVAPLYLEDSGSVDIEKLKIFQEKYALSQPFMINSLSPSPLLAASEKENKPLIRVNLPKFTQTCDQHFFNEESYQQYDCDYIPESIIKIVNEKLETSNPDVYRLLSRFTLYQESYLNDILYSISQGKSNTEAICDFIKGNDAFVSQIVTQKDVFTENKVSSVTRFIFISLSSILLAYTTLHAFLLYWYIHDPNIKGSSVLFLSFIIMGAFFYFSWIVVLSLDPTETTCALAPWLQHLGFSLAFLAIIIKSMRVALLFNGKLAMKAGGTRKLVTNLKDSRLLMYYLGFMFIIAVYLTVWTIVAKPTPQKSIISAVTVDDHVETTFEFVCATNESFKLVGFIIQVIILLIACFIAILVRKLPSSFNESTLIGISVYNAFFCLIISCIVFFASVNTEIEYVLTCIFSLLAMALVIVLLVSSKILYACLGWVHQSSLPGSGSRKSSGNGNKQSSLFASRPSKNQRGQSFRGQSFRGQSNRGRANSVHKEAVKSIVSMIEDEEIIECGNDTNNNNFNTKHECLTAAAAGIDDGGVYDGSSQTEIRMFNASSTFVVHDQDTIVEGGTSV